MMKIAQVCPLYEAVPPRLYGGTERIVSFLSDELVKLGHDVTLFASADSCTLAELHAVRDCALRLDPNPLSSDLAAHIMQLLEVRERADQFDIIHFHTDMLHFPFFLDVASRTVTTLHGRLDLRDLPHVYRRFSEYPLASISHSQRQPLAFANWIGTVPHGIDSELLTPRRAPRGDYVAFIGRISPEKRPDRAIAIAQAAGVPIRIAAKVDAADKQYFHKVVEPMLNLPGVEFIGEISDCEKSDLLGHASALLFPIDWPEPFGLVMIEAMACGTPVIAWGNGSVLEVIEDGLTGFIVDDFESAVAAVPRVRSLSRAQIRARFDQRFSARVMALSYLDVYERVLQNSQVMSTVAA